MIRFSTLQQNKLVIFISSLSWVKMLCLSCDRVWFRRQMRCLRALQLQMDLWAAFNTTTIEHQIFGALRFYSRLHVLAACRDVFRFTFLSVFSQLEVFHCISKASLEQ